MKNVLPIRLITTLLLILVFAVSNANAIEEFKITASDADRNDEFGNSVSISGDYALIGSPRNNDDGYQSGSAYVFLRNDGEWIEQAKLTASDADSGDHFGLSLSIDGDYAIIGAYRNDDNGELSGAAYIFARNGDEWTQQAKLTASDACAGDYFGLSVSISGDYAIAGAYGNDDRGENSGSAYIFIRDGDDWVEQAKITTHDANFEDYFGCAVSINGDYAVVGAEGDSDFGISSGSAYIFAREGGEWREQAKINADDEREVDILGSAVSINGNYAVVGASLDDDHGENSGSAYIFVKDGEDWTQQAKLNASDAGAEDYFGFSVSISGDRTIVGAYGNGYDRGEISGSAYIFLREGDEWSETGKILSSDIASGDGFGYSVSIHDEYAIAGSPGDSDDGGYSGSAYIYSGLDSLAVDSNDKSFPLSYFLSPAYPNPFNSTTRISFDLPINSNVLITLVDLNGRQVCTLADVHLTAGSHSLTWNAKDYPTGVYLCRMEAGGFVDTRKLMLVR
jgi:hypothetical protein